MALNDILQSIKEQAQKEIDAVKKQAENERSTISKEWGEKIDAKKKLLTEDTRQRALNKLQQARFVIHSRKQAKILEAKQQLIEKVYQTALKNLKKIDDSKYESLMEKSAAKLPDVSGKIFLTESDERAKIVKKVIKNKKYTIEKETVKGSGGFVFSSKDIDIDNTFEAMVDSLRKSTQTEVSKILFG